MFLVYFDESGDPGDGVGSTASFIVTALIVHESFWRVVFERFKEFRKKLKEEHDIPIYTELKGYNIINHTNGFKRLKNSNRGAIHPWERLIILRKTVDFLASLSGLIECQNVCCKKRKRSELDLSTENIAERRFLRTWSYSLQRVEAHIYYKEKTQLKFTKDISINDHTIQDEWVLGKINCENAMILPDNTNNQLLVQLSRRMHKHNFVPFKGGLGYGKRTIDHILGDPCFQDSKDNYFIQFADIVSYCLSKHIFPNTVPLNYKKLKISNSYKLENLFPRLDPILCKEAAKDNPYGIKIFHE